MPTEVGSKVVLDEVDGGPVTHYAILTGNPPDAPNSPDSLDHHRAGEDAIDVVPLGCRDDG
jgi:hypothetical protein